MTDGDSDRIDRDSVDNLYQQHAAELRAFLTGVLRDREQAADALQATFRKALESGHTARAETIKGWLFRVALNEARVVQRRQQVVRRSFDRLIEKTPQFEESEFERVCRREDIERVREALQTLPDKLRQVVQLRIYEQKTFATIAEELNTPLSTVLTRMRTALQKLSKILSRDQ